MDIYPVENYIQGWQEIFSWFLSSSGWLILLIVFLAMAIIVATSIAVFTNK